MLRDLSIKRKLYVGFGAILAIILALLIIAYNRFNSLSEANQWDRHTMDVIQAIDALRSPRHRFHSANKSLEVGGAQQASAPVSFNPEHIGLRELVLRLKPRQREVIDLLYFGGCTQVEAAEQLGIPLATVKTRARAALLVLGQLAK